MIDPWRHMAPKNVTELLASLRRGDTESEEQLMQAVYPELRRLAAQYLRRERAGHTLQPTALVNEAWLRMGGQLGPDCRDRTHFFAMAASIMRHILVDHARRRQSRKRGAGAARVDLDDAVAFTTARPEEVIAIDEALERLAKLDARQARIVEMRFFSGLSVEETAQALELSTKTVKRDWAMARAWLHRELNSGRADDARPVEED